MPYEALGLAAGAMSKAIGDIYRGQVEATSQVPRIEEHAQNQAMRAQEISQRMQKFPLEMAEIRQKMSLGDFALQEAPLKIEQLKGSIEGQNLTRQLHDIQLKSAGDEFNMKLKSRETAKAFIEANKDKPGMEWISAYASNPDSFLDAWTKMKTEEAKASFHPHSFDQILGALAQKKASGQPLTPQEQKVYDEAIAWKMKTNNMAITPGQTAAANKDLWAQASKTFVESMTQMFGKDMSKIPGATQAQKQMVIDYYKAEIAAQLYDSNPGFQQLGVPRPTLPQKPPWLAQYEAQIMQQQQTPTWMQWLKSWIPGQSTPAPAPAPAQNSGWEIVK